MSDEAWLYLLLKCLYRITYRTYGSRPGAERQTAVLSLDQNAKSLKVPWQSWQFRFPE